MKNNKKQSIIVIGIIVLVVGVTSYYLGTSKSDGVVLPGCTSTVGYSSSTGQKCDGTTLPQVK